MLSDNKSDIHRLEELREFAEAPRLFWPAYATALCNLLGATRLRIVLRDHGDASPGWKRIAAHAKPDAPRPLISDADSESLADRAIIEGFAEIAFSENQRVVSLPLKTGTPTHDCVMIAEIAVVNHEAFVESIHHAQLVADVPASYRNFRALKQSQSDVSTFASTLDLLTLINRHAKFEPACLALANELASRFKATYVAIGWEKGGYVKLRAISNMQSFEKKMERILRVESAMEEALSQDDEILLPLPTDSIRITRDHEALLQQESLQAVLSVPIRIDGKPVAVFTILRHEQAFTEAEVRAAWIIADQVAKPLATLNRDSRWFGARMAESVATYTKSHWNLEHPWQKLGTVTLLIVVLVLFFGRITYRVDAPFIVHTYQQAIVPAPFDGYIQESSIRIGDEVAEGQVLLQLDDSELKLRKASYEADIRRFRSESELARAQNKFAEMRVALAQMEQNQAALELTQHEINSAQIRAPFASTVADEARLRERLGAPVKAGETLIRLARPDQLYLEIDIDERDIHEVVETAKGQFAFTSEPSKKYPMSLVRVDPIANSKQDKTIFFARAAFDCPPEKWWRPGMTGMAKIEVGPRTFFWIITHRLVDFLHIKLWLF
ncbi:MAG: efflux RND transporter periplasmic adaptor subunit [Verrucomicrobiota bacterium]|nr:efflux RND transporter periplasmic adaptor subunit [Verrucomicrobiota bacterium]